jgi:tetratricopeptide (TPR) repeat protein
MCADASERALEHIRLAGDRFEEQEITEWLAIALFLGPAPAAAAAQRCGRLLEETAGQPLLHAMIMAGQALLVAMQGHIDEANELRARSRTIMSELGEWIWIASFWLALISLWGDDPVAAERELQPGYEALKKLGSTSHLSSFAHLLARAVYAQGRYDEAEQLTEECEEVSRPNDVHSQILMRSMRAKVLARRGLLEAAEQLAREAVAFASKSDFHSAHADALMDLAEVLEVAGNAKDAAIAVEEAVRFYDLKGNVLAADRARSQLEAYA